MDIFALCIEVIFVLLFLINSIIKNSNNRKYDKYEFVVRIPTMVSLIGVIIFFSSIITMICFSIFSYPKPHIIFYIVFSFFMCLGLYLFMKTMIFRVFVNDINIKVQPLFSKEYSCTFMDINSVKKQTKKNGAERIIIKFKSKKKLIIENSEYCYREFIEKINLYKITINT